MRTISSLLLGAALSLALVSGVSAQALNANKAGLSNITIGVGSTNRGNAGLDNSASLGGGRITATTNSATKFGNGVNQNPAGNNGIGGAAGGFSETTFLRAGGEGIANTTLSGNGTLNGSFNQNTTNSGSTFGNNNNLNQTTSNGSTNLNGNGTLAGSFTRTANSYAGAGLQGYSGSQMVGGPGSVSNSTNGAAFGVGVAVTGGAGLTGGAGHTNAR